METEVPSNVTIHKDEKPKHWSHLLKTGEIISGIKIGDLITTIYHSNSNPDHRWLKPLEKNRLRMELFWLSYGGPRSKSVNVHNDIMGVLRQLVMGSRIVPSKYRKRLNEAVVKEILPKMNDWLKEVQQNPMCETTEDGISAVYEHQTFLPPSYKHVNRLVIYNRKKEELWSQEWNIEEDEKVLE